MKKQRISQEENDSAKESRRQRAKERLFATVREIQQANKDADPDQVLADVTEAVEAVRQEEYEREKSRGALDTTS
jgi:hypothetical protein